MTKPKFKAAIIAHGAEYVPSSLRSIEPTLKAGGFATLLRAEGANGHYAVKLFKNNMGYSVAEAEYRRLEVLRGCGCVPDVHCVGWLSYDGVSYPAIVEDYVDGYTLADVLDSGLLTGVPHAPLSDVDTATIMLGNAYALETLGRFGIVHRDLSLGNSLVDNECVREGMAKGAHVMLIDLGQSVFETAEITPNGHGRLATIAVAAPEIYGGIHYDRRNACSVDAYSLALMTVALRIGGYWWPEALRELKARLEQGHVLRHDDCADIVKAKTVPVNMVEIMASRGMTVSATDESISEIIHDLTAYDPTLRPTMAEVVASLEPIVWRAGRSVAVTARRDGQTIPILPSETPLVQRNRSRTPTKTASSDPSSDQEQGLVGCVVEETHFEEGTMLGISNETLERFASRGDSSACRILGVRYTKDGKTSSDAERGTALLAKAADAGDAEAAYLLGCNYWDGLGVSKNPLEAIRCFQQAADGHHSGACYRLGWCYEYGMCGARDAVRAFLLYQEASRGGHGPATRRLAMLLWEGRGIPQDTERAADMFRRASRMGDVPATRSLGWCYECGCGVKQDLERAAKLYGDAASKGDESAAQLLERLRKET